MPEIDQLLGVRRIFLDTAPIIYFVEANARYRPFMRTVFDSIEAGRLFAVTSPVTLAECLVMPYRLGQYVLAETFQELIVRGAHTLFVNIDPYSASKSAELRARYNLTLTDALQAAVAITTGCDAFLTNDSGFKRVSELSVMHLETLI